MFYWQILLGVGAAGMLFVVGLRFGVLRERDEVRKREPTESIAQIDAALRVSIGRVEDRCREIESELNASSTSFDATNKRMMATRSQYFTEVQTSLDNAASRLAGVADRLDVLEQHIGSLVAYNVRVLHDVTGMDSRQK